MGSDTVDETTKIQPTWKEMSEVAPLTPNKSRRIGKVPHASVFLADKEAAAIKDFMRNHISAQYVTLSQIEEFLRVHVGGIQARLSLKYILHMGICVIQNLKRGFFLRQSYRGCHLESS